MIKNISKKIDIAAMLLGIAGICLYFFSLYWVNDTVKGIEVAYKAAESDITTNRKLSAIKAIEVNNSLELSVLDNFFIKSGDEASFIDDIESLAKQVGVEMEIVSIVPDTKAKATFKEDLQVRINMSGEWNSIYNFLDRLSKQSFGIEQRNVLLDYDKSGVWNGSVLLVVFREK